MLKCDACSDRARYGASIPREKRGAKVEGRAVIEARFVLCPYHAANVRAYKDSLIWALPEEALHE